mmetsp:Transcript_52780/g.171727  ORF Transcript_52780/g.171727 Transcript_52780/m.171727 type:complete len:530 (-) Transcript_52780:130-1719(-)
MQVACFSDVSEDVLPSLVSHLEPATLGQLAGASAAFASCARSDEVWKALALNSLWPRDEGLLKLLVAGEVSPWDAKHGSQGGRSLPRAKALTWRSLFRAQRAASAVLVVDIGFGYTKFGSGPRCAAPAEPLRALQLCSSPTHRADAPRGRQLAAVAARAAPPAGLGRTRILKCPPFLVCEPFNILSEDEANVWRDSFIKPQLPAGAQCLFCPQPMLALLAHGGHADGVAVNIGQRETVVVPILNGEIVWTAILTGEGMGASTLTQVMLEMLVTRNVGVNSDMLTWCRDLKEAHCAVAPERVDAEAASGFAPAVEVRRNGRLSFQLGLERFLVPEVFFRPGPACLPRLVLQAVGTAVSTCPAERRPEVAARLLSAVAVVGGTAEMPGLRQRLQNELQGLLRTEAKSSGLGFCKTPPEVKVLAPLSGMGGPRAAVCHGGQLAAIAACSAGWLENDVGAPDIQLKVQEEEEEKTEVVTPDLTLCCATSWRRPTRIRDIKSAISAAHRCAASTSAALCRLWRSAVGSSPEGEA